MNVQLKKVVVISSIVFGVSLIVVFGVIPVVKKNGIRKRLDEAYNDPASDNAVGGSDKLLLSEAFDRNSFDTNQNKATISRLEAREKSKQIWDNYSAFFSSNQIAIVSAFSGLGHVVDVSKIAHEFYESYDKELLSVIKTALTEKAKMNLLIGKIKKLPKK